MGVEDIERAQVIYIKLHTKIGQTRKCKRPISDRQGTFSDK